MKIVDLLKGSYQSILALFVVAFCFFSFNQMIANKIVGENIQMILVGALITTLATVVQFYFGNSHDKNNDK